MNTNIENIQELTKQEVMGWEKEAEHMNGYAIDFHKLGKINKEIYRDIANCCNISENMSRNMIECHKLKIEISHIAPVPPLPLKIWIQALPLTVPSLQKLKALNYAQQHNLTASEFGKYIKANFMPLPRRAKTFRKCLLKLKELFPDISIKEIIMKSEELKDLLEYLVSQAIANNLVNISEIEDQLRIMNQTKAA